MIEQQQRDLAHGDREYEEPADGADEEEAWGYHEVEREEEDDTANIPFATPEKSFLRLALGALM